MDLLQLQHIACLIFIARALVHPFTIDLLSRLRRLLLCKPCVRGAAKCVVVCGQFAQNVNQKLT
jgi:hypothetical protein